MRHALGCVGFLLAGSSAFAADHVVTAFAGPLRFEPETLEIEAGDSVTFVNGGGFHNVVSDDGAITAFRCANGCDGVIVEGVEGNGDVAGNDWSATVVFPVIGAVGYYCEQHGASGGAGMSGSMTIVLKQGIFTDGFETIQ